MNPTSTLLLAFSLSSDAFAASVSKGACVRRLRFIVALQTGLMFGLVEATTPIIGWMLGSSAHETIRDWDHWIIFFLLLALGGKMIQSGLMPRAKDCASCDCGATTDRTRWWLIIATAVTTSLDAMAVGVGLAFMEANIWITALTIGAATTLMATLGMLLGRKLGKAVGPRAEIIGGLVLIGIGATTLHHHLLG
ncbi:manganese efflux pump MntP family protein [Halomonas denitrificans]|uniref:manganese efflux pump MntP n=1 Tax=Halomonas TaxID=2745 RepID=UPI001A8C0CA5|nr:MULTISPECIES: manganese efflux pump MntP family protein [Halomonas]MED5297315.1 manganese efflux pump MntP family protein [Pseudomonadota bacterium]MBN8414105.1 manganese efflux pump [Halomonas litopenaei]MBY5927200.1 manganese efflux pump MntP family protein [Halomonas sp. DP4Y7-2]MBY5930755.1 manganese efflux pump MntP family protein [Halomonas sp. DP8Y7-3]MBY5986105.1 manganese efflux pump MntP family protein [Halomonas sp. DP5Y7-2]